MFSRDKISEYLSKEWIFVKLGASVVFLSATQMLILFTTMIFAGQISQAHLDGIGLSNTVLGLTVIAICVGFSTVFDTYGPQVYGSQQKRELGTVLQKCLLQGAVLYLLLLGPFFNVVHLIKLLPSTYGTAASSNTPSSNTSSSSQDGIGQGGEESEQDFRDIAAEYLRMVSLLGYLDYCIILLSRYFAIQRKVYLVYVVSFVMILSHVVFNYMLVTVAGMGTSGIALAAYLGRGVVLGVCVALCYVMIGRGTFMWNGFTWRALLGWKQMFKLGLSGWINVLAEMGLFEASIFCSQFDGTTALSVVIITNQIQALVWSVTSGICCASSTLIGTALGEGNKREVKQYVVFSVVNVLTASLTLALIELCLQSYLVQIFSPTPEVVALFKKTFWIAVIMGPPDHIQVVLNRGILTAFGKQRFIAISLSVSCYVVGLPIIMGTIFFTDFIVSGIFLGYGAFFIAAMVSAAIRISLFNIDEEIEKTKVRVGFSDERTGNGEDHPEAAIGIDNPVYVKDENEVVFPPSADNEISQKCDSEASPPSRFSKNEILEIRNVLIAFSASVAWTVFLSGISLI